MWFKAFTWMRIYDPTAFFLRLLSETFEDVKNFFFMFIVIITAFANIIYIFNKQSMALDETPLYERDLEVGILNSWLT